ncbi:hypothetical protein [Streptomyces sp. NPDC057939]|uniref:hypothetical protein n=1 Tax=Streptomyces sp. NPDC057939 TaxID=3346284 RepID=UPI0036E71497
MLIDEVLGRYDFHEVHTLVVPASPEAVWRALDGFTPADVPAAVVLMGLRTLPTRLAGLVRRDRPAPGATPDGGASWHGRVVPGASAATGRQGTVDARVRTLRDAMAERFVPLAERAGEETVSGAAGQWWKPSAPFVPLDGPDDFREFRTPGHLKAAINFRVTAHPRGALLRTETRVVAFDARTRRVFVPYWHLLARPLGGIIRQAMLRAVARRAMAAGSTT